MEEKGTGEINSFFDEYGFEQNVEYDKKSKGNIITIESAEKMIFFKKL